MKCLRCGHCCINYMVVIPDKPEKGLAEDNLVVHKGIGKPCQHLEGNKPGEYSCIVHNKSWYKKTPCFSHGQIELSTNDVCRMGEYILHLKKEKKNGTQKTI